jgi:hypothetical protein
MTFESILEHMIKKFLMMYAVDNNFTYMYGNVFGDCFQWCERRRNINNKFNYDIDNTCSSTSSDKTYPYDSDDQRAVFDEIISQPKKFKPDENITDILRKLYQKNQDDIFRYRVTDNKITKKFENTDVKSTKKAKKNIPKAVRTACWDKWIGREKGVAKCLCCNINEISQFNFACGHITSEHNGGETTVENLKPVCTSCNSSMSTKNMDEFVKTHKLN